MPVHEIRYRTWQGDLLPSYRRLLAIPRFTLLAIFNKWIALGMFAGMGQLFLYTFYLLISTNPLIRQMLDIRQAQFDIVSASQIFHYFYVVQFIVCIIVSLLATPRMISPEIQHNALPLIYSRPITRSGYIAGKFMAISLLLSLLTWVQAIVLFLFMMAIYPDTYPFWTNFWSAGTTGEVASIMLLVDGVLLGLIVTVCVGLFALACSSATRNFLHSGVLFLCILFGTSFITLFLQESFNFAGFPDLGLREIVFDLSRRWFEGKSAADVPYYSILPGILVWSLGSFLFMRWRLRPVDICGD